MTSRQPWRDKKYLEIALERYRRFLFVRQQFPDVFLVPSYDIDTHVMWHTHLLHPRIYLRDTHTLMGRPFNHNDSVNDRGAGSKLSRADSETPQLWKDTFGEDFTLYGAMYRGAPPSGKLRNVPADRWTEMASKKTNVIIEKLEIRGTSRNERQFKIDVSVKTSDFYQRVDAYVKKKVEVARLDWGSLWEGNVCQFDFDTVEFSAIHFNAHKRYGRYCCSSEDSIGSVVHNIVSTVEDAYPNNKSKRVSVLFPKDNGTTTMLDLTYKITSLRLGPVTLLVTPGIYESAIIPETAEQLWGPVPLARLPPDTENTSQVASHRLVNHLGNAVFTCQTIHSIPLMMSAIQVYYKDKLVVVGHLIGTDQLPLKSQVSKDNKECASLQAGVGERAVLIKNSDGDWGILLGRWEGLRKGTPGTKESRGKRGSPGNLRAEFFKLGTKTWKPMKANCSYEIKVNDISVNLETGCIKAPPPHSNLSENICVAFGVALLHVLCQPRQKSGAYRGGRRIETIPSAEMVLLLAAGYNVSTPTNHHVYAVHKKRQNDRCPGCIGMGGAWTEQDVINVTDEDTEDIMDCAAVYGSGEEGDGDGGRVDGVDAGCCGGCGGNASLL